MNEHNTTNDTETDEVSTTEQPLTTNRRDLLKGLGTAGAVATTGGASLNVMTDPVAAAESDDEDWLANGWGFASQSIANAARKAAQHEDIAIIAAVGPVAYGVGRFLYGEYQENINERTANQMHLDHYTYVDQINRTLVDLLKENYNNIQLGMHKTVASAKWAVVEAMKSDAGSTQAELDARQAVFESGAVFEKNLLQAISAAFVKMHSVRELQTTHSGISDPHIAYYMDTDTNQPEDPTDTVDIDIELMDGTTHTAKALHITANHDDSLLGHYVHPYFFSTRMSDDTILSDYAENPASGNSDYDTLWQLSYQWDNNGGHRTAFQYDKYDSNNPAIQVFDSVGAIDGIGDVLVGENQHIANYAADILRERYITLANEMQTLAADAYAAYSNGQIEPEDLIDPYMMAQQNAGSWRETGHFGYAGSIASMQGYSSDLSKMMKISYYDASETTTQSMTGMIAASPDVVSSTSTDTLSLSGWTFDSSLDTTALDGEHLTRRKSHTVTHTDDSGTSTTLVEGDDYSVSWQTDNESIRINSDGSNIGSYTAGNGTIDVQVTADITTSQTWETGQTYTVASDGDIVFSKTQESGGGMLIMDANDEYTVEKIWDADGNQIQKVTSSTYNIQTKEIGGLIEQLRGIVKAQKDLESSSTTSSGGGGGGSGSSGFDLGISKLEGGGIIGLLVGSLWFLNKTKSDNKPPGRGGR